MMPARKAQQGGVLLSELLAGIATVAADDDRAVQGVAQDSRQVQPGYLFLACEGLVQRGHDFIATAVARGAAAIVYEIEAGECAFSSAQVGTVPLVAAVNLSHQAGVIAERFYGYPSQDLFVVGITGTNGKTSCSHFLAQALHRDDRPCGIVGTLGNGLVDQLTPGTHTTPDAVTLHRLFAEMRDAGARSVAMEVSSHALDQGRVAGVSFAAAVFTNLSRDHLDYHGDMAAYAATKQALFQAPGLRYAVVNGDDAFGREILADLRFDVTAVSYGLGGAVAENIPHVHGTVTQLSRSGLTMAVHTPWGEGSLHSPLLGRFNASNLLAVLATLLVNGMALPEALQRLAQVRPVTGRMECFGGDGYGPLVVVDYAHTPDALEQALSALREHCRGQLWCVFGCGGDRDRGKRPLMGAAAARLADHIIITDDNPRTEEPTQISDDIIGGIPDKAAATLIHDRTAAIAAAVKQAGMDDVVLVAGKGHETAQHIGTRKLPFRDQEVVRRCLAERGR
jgi:UDP-N-acetylmuramoyl-L-alanyl-D-glutamate--2,6-diaminopimelate ligase